MDFTLSSSHLLYGGNKVSPEWEQYMLPQAQRLYKQFQEGELCSQVILGNDYSLCLHGFHVFENLIAEATTSLGILALQFMLEGEMKWKNTAGEQTILSKDSSLLVYYPSNTSHRIELREGWHWYMHINFHPALLQPVATQYPLFAPMLSAAKLLHENTLAHKLSVMTPYIRTLVREMINVHNEVGTRELLIAARIRDVLRWYVQDQVGKADQAAVSQPQQQLLHTIEVYIKNHLDENISVNALAAYLRVSRSWLQRISKNALGKGIHEWVTEIRMQEAANLLLMNDAPVSEIISRTSDMNFSSFSAAFKLYYGMTPKEYRNNRGQNKK